MITIDVSTAANEGELHVLLKQELGFPAFYGMNWDAFWDAITGLVTIPGHIRFIGWEHLTESVPRGAAKLRQALARYQAEYRPAFVPEYV